MSLDPSPLLAPFRLGDLELKNRVVMAPLTRNRATPGTDAPRDLNARYYAQRAGAGLIVSEGSQISQEGQGYLWTPGIYTEAQVEGWRKVTDAVHAAGGRIFIQLWHVGRVSHVSLQEGGKAPVAPSAILAKTKTFIEGGFADTSDAARARDGRGQARRRRLRPRRGQRQGRRLRRRRDPRRQRLSGRPVPARLLEQARRHLRRRHREPRRFALEVVDAIAKVWPSSRIGIRIAPVSPANDISDSIPQALFGHLVEKLSERRIGYIHVVEGPTGGRATIAPFDCAALSAPSRAPISPTTATPARWRSRRCATAAPISSPSAAGSSPTPISSSG